MNLNVAGRSRFVQARLLLTQQFLAIAAEKIRRRSELPQSNLSLESVPTSERDTTSPFSPRNPP